MVKFNYVKSKFFLIAIYLLAGFCLFGKDNPKVLIAQGEELYNQGLYKEALHYFIKADSLTNNAMVCFWIGKILLSIPDRQLEALPYFERSVELKNPPYEVHLHLGKLYHQTFHFDKASRQFRLYLSKAPKDDGFRGYAERMLEVIANAKKDAGIPINKSVRPLSSKINSGYAEYAPYISADMQTMVFTRLENENDRLIKRFFITNSIDGELWNQPKELKISGNYSITDIELAGISQDGSILYLSIGNGRNNNLYSSKIQGDQIIGITLLTGEINSRFGEYAISFSADGTYCIFSSSRPGGYGGCDLYRAEKNSDGSFSNAKNLGPIINTQNDENYPFFHPDGKKLVFASEGHSSIGGYDIFETELNSSGLWNSPRPIAYVNTVYDDRFYMMDARGQKAIFSQSLNYFPGRYKIFVTDLKENIPLTMVKGIILSGNPPKPVKAQIKVYDHITKQRIKYAYSPDEYTGRYLMIFPPDRNYDIFIEADGFLPQLINVYIPEQKYFYELYQEITLNAIEVNNRRIGENVKVRNSFYDVSSLGQVDSTLSEYAEKKDYDKLLQMIGDIIYQTDSLGMIGLDQMTTKNNKQQKKDYQQLFDLIGQAIEATDNVSLALLDQNTQYDEVVSSPTYYGDNSSLGTKVFGHDTIKFADYILTSEQRVIVPSLVISDSLIQLRKSKPSERKYVFVDQIYFNLNDITILPKYYELILSVSEILHNNSQLGVELHGYTDPKGTEKYNYRLSDHRAKSVQRHLVGLGISPSRIITIPHGIDNQSKNFEQLRRVEIKVFEIRR